MVGRAVAGSGPQPAQAGLCGVAAGGKERQVAALAGEFHAAEPLRAADGGPVGGAAGF